MKHFSFLLSCICLFFFIISSCQQSPQKQTVENSAHYPKSELEVQHGMALFNQHCASCHNFMGNEIGPNLNGITSKVSKEWLVNFIHNPQAVIDQKDERAVALFQQYKMYMPPFPHIKDKDLDDLLGFIHKFSEAEKKNKSNRTGGLVDPIKKKIYPSDLSLVIEEWLTIPPSSETSPKTRINKIETVKTQGKERLFVDDLRGKLYEIVDNKPVVYMDFQELEEQFIHTPGFGTGLGSVAFHPDFEHNGRLYTTHTEPAKTQPADFAIADSVPVKLQWVLLEWETQSPSATPFSGSKRELLRVDMVTQIHEVQEIAFNPLVQKGDADYGMLYVGVGDGGAALAGHPYLCDDPNRIWGSVLRIQPEKGNSANGNYSIPKDNPFADGNEGLPEIWARGFRNPHRFSWDRSGTKKMLISNIGQHSVEEVNLGEKGGHYGWPHREGTFLFDPEANTELVYPVDETDSTFIPPVLQYDHDEGNAVSGGYVYTSDLIPDLKGKYLFGDIPRGFLFYADATEIEQGKQTNIHGLGLEFYGEKTSLAAMNPNQRVDLRFGTNQKGEVFIFTKSNGTIYRITGVKKSTL